MNDIRFCSECKNDPTLATEIDCGLGNHKWHTPDEYDGWDMCCECGKDVEYLLK